jgi:hypothetical protein
MVGGISVKRENNAIRQDLVARTVVCNDNEMISLPSNFNFWRISGPLFFQGGSVILVKYSRSCIRSRNCKSDCECKKASMTGLRSVSSIGNGGFAKQRSSCWTADLSRSSRQEAQVLQTLLCMVLNSVPAYPPPLQAITARCMHLFKKPLHTLQS